MGTNDLRCNCDWLRENDASTRDIAQECYISVAEETAQVWAPKCAQLIVNAVMERIEAIDNGVA